MPLDTSCLRDEADLASPGCGAPSRRRNCAVFVALTSEASVHHPSAAAKHAVQRLVSHTSARGECKDLTSTGTVRWLPVRPECHSDLLLFTAGTTMDAGPRLRL